MQCYFCGTQVPATARTCTNCGRPRSKRIYVPFWGVAGGLAGSFIGFTAFNIVGALLGGLVGIVFCEILARLALRPKSRRPTA